MSLLNCNKPPVRNATRTGSVLWLTLLLGLTGVPADKIGAKESHEIPADDIFAGTNVLRIKILIPNSGMSALRNSSGWGNGQERAKVKAVVREGNTVYTNVEIHLKGAAGSFRPVDDNPGLTLNFEKLAPGQTFHGYRKISLNNSVQDRSFLTEKICRELFETAGVPAPHAGFAKVELNGRNLGLRVMVEGWGKHFLKRYFKNTDGNLYDGGFVEDISADGRLGVNSGANPQDNSGLIALVDAVENLKRVRQRREDPSAAFARLEQALDMDRFLSFMAMDIMVCDWDGYPMNHNNWRLFHDQESNKMVFMPHGMDQMFGVERTSPQCPILPAMRGAVAQAVIGVPEGRRRYLERMCQLYTNVWHVDAILKRVDQLNAVIRPVLAESSSSSARYHDSEVENLKERISERDQSLRLQLGNLKDHAVKVAVNTTLRPSGWAPKTHAGNGQFRHEQGQDGHDLLYVSINGDSICSWRAPMKLEEGTYRFEGKLRTRNVKASPAEPSGGAGLRVHLNALAEEVTGSNDWQTFSYPFQVLEGSSAVELICELRGSKGEAWFDTSSMSVVRVR
ncbi:MAG TPA: CotH kinase family protein [Verrucomicrobiae bacterium]|nr:CotH kinase family protein [Verrucomicrobiae bacterium]